MLTLTLQGLAGVLLIRLLLPMMTFLVRRGRFRKLLVVEAILLGLLATAVAQVAVWACAFVLVGAVADYGTAFYHSAVNFTTLGYGDIVMDPPWRLLGPIESINGILMLGTSSAMLNAAFAQLSRIEAR